MVLPTLEVFIFVRKPSRAFATILSGILLYIIKYIGYSIVVCEGCKILEITKFGAVVKAQFPLQLAICLNFFKVKIILLKDWIKNTYLMDGVFIRIM